MRHIIRSQSQLLFRKSYKPNRILRIRLSAKAGLTFRPSRAGPQKPKYECRTDSAQVRPDGRTIESA